MNNITVFENEEFGQVRTIVEGDKVLFCASDVAKALGYSRPADAVSAHCKGSVKHRSLTNGGEQAIKYIPEGDVYRLIMHSKLPSAERFECWVVDEVLPSIRKHGMYAEDELLQNPDLLLKVVTQLKQEHDERLAAEKRAIALQEENAEKDKQLEEAKPKVQFADAVHVSDTCILIGELAKLLKGNGINIGQNRLFEWLRENGYLIKRKGTDYNIPTQKAMDMKLFKVIESTVTNNNGNVIITKTTKVTGKGQQYFVNIFLNNKPDPCVHSVDIGA